MSESEVKSAASLQLRVLGVIFPLLVAHSIPDRISALVLPYVIKFRQYKQQDAKDIDAYEDTIASPILWFVIIQIKEISNDIAYLHVHLLMGKKLVSQLVPKKNCQDLRYIAQRRQSVFPRCWNFSIPKPQGWHLLSVLVRRTGAVGGVGATAATYGSRDMIVVL